MDSAGEHWVKFSIRRAPVSSERPHGLQYSLTLHDKTSERLVGLDNAHDVLTGSGPGARRLRNHKHRFRSVKPRRNRNLSPTSPSYQVERNRNSLERYALSSSTA